MSNVKLKPCPFCGSTDIWPSSHRNPFALVCGNCSAEGPPKSYVDTTEATAAWNARAGLRPLSEAPKDGSLVLAAERPPQDRMFYYDVFWDDDRQDFVSGVHRARNGATHFMDPELMPELPDEYEDFDDED